MYHRGRNIFGIVVLGVMVVWTVAVGIRSVLYEQSQPATVSYTGGSVQGSANGSWAAPQSGSSPSGLSLPQVTVSSQRPRSTGSYHSSQSSRSSGNNGGASYAGALHTSSSQRVHSVGGGGYAGGAVSYSSSSRRATSSVSGTYAGGGYAMPMIAMNVGQASRLPRGASYGNRDGRPTMGNAAYNPYNGNRDGYPTMRRAGEVTGDPTSNPGVGGGVSGNGYVGGDPTNPGVNYSSGYVTGGPTTNPCVNYNPGYVTGDPTGDATDNPNIVPLGDGLWILAIMSAGYYTYRRRKRKKADS